MKKGDEITFTASIYLEATSEWPTQLLANKGERGSIIEKSIWGKFEWKVQPENGNPFYAKENEFKMSRNGK